MNVLVLVSWSDLRVYDSIYLIDCSSPTVSADLKDVLLNNSEIDGGSGADLVWEYCRNRKSVAATHCNGNIKLNADKVVLVYMY